MQLCPRCEQDTSNDPRHDEVCYWRWVASDRLEKIDILQDRIEQLEDELRACESMLEGRANDQKRGLIRRALHWLLWEC